VSRKLKLPDRYEQPPKHTFSGGQGQIFVCRDKNLNRDVAIKIITDVSDKESIQNEITALCNIQSKHVVQLFDFVEDIDAKSVGIVQEYIPGNDLSQFNGGGHNVSFYLKTIYQIASGLADIHAAGKIHRDIKPSNMKADGEGIVKIFDFGLSCHASPLPETTAARGTYVYRAPELYDAPTTFTEAVDTYAFGITAWQMLSTSFPNTLLDIPPLKKGPAPSFATLATGLTDEIINIFDRTLSAEPSDRPSMKDVKETIALKLLFGSHNGLLSYGTQTHKIAKVNSAITVNVPGIGGFDIFYDGYHFKLRKITCATFINNVVANDGQMLPGSCVLTVMKGPNRQFLTFDISHPEVVL
jgi:serine/threonine protein kinase